MQVVQTVKHPAELGLIAQITNQCGYGSVAFGSGRGNAHTRQPVRPAVIQKPLDIDAIFTWFFEIYFSNAFNNGHEHHP